MTTPPTQEEWDEAFSRSHELNPTPSSWGLFTYSDAPPNICGSGLGTFQWFRTKTQMLRFVRDYMAWWHPGPSSMSDEEIAERVQSIVKSVDPKEADLGRLRTRLNKFMLCLWHIEWWGQFRDLCDGRSKYAVKVRRSFLDDEEKLTRGSQISRSQMNDFKEYLREYGY